MDSKMKQTISILGCGWLGFPLALALQKQGYRIKGSTTTPQKIAQLQRNHIDAYQIQLLPEIQADNINEFLQASILILNIPPRVRRHGENFHWLQIQHLMPAIISSPVQKILFISSTSVYGSEQGKVTEQTPPQPDKTSGKLLLKVENYLRKSKFQVTILRLAGLLGEDRHPITTLAGKQNLSRGNAPINLIHLQDCIGIVREILQQQKWEEVFNAAADNHSPRRIFYPQIARIMGLEPPTFAEEQQPNCKVICNHKVKNVLGYVFQYSLSELRETHNF